MVQVETLEILLISDEKNGSHHWIFLAKSSYPDEFHRISRQLDFHVFLEDGCPMTPRDEIVYENLESWEMS